MLCIDYMSLIISVLFWGSLWLSVHLAVWVFVDVCMQMSEFATQLCDISIRRRSNNKFSVRRQREANRFLRIEKKNYCSKQNEKSRFFTIFPTRSHAFPATPWLSPLVFAPSLTRAFFLCVASSSIS